MNIEEAKQKLKENLSPRRYVHSVNVMMSAVKLAERYGADAETAAMAGLLHDCARDIKGDEIFALCSRYGIEVDEISALRPALLHGQIGARIAADEYGFCADAEDKCQSPLSAICYHTTGYPGMNLMDKIIFLADFIEPERDFPSVKAIRKTAFEDIDKAVLMGLDSTILYIVGKGWLLHPDTVHTRNWLINEMKNKA